MGILDGGEAEGEVDADDTKEEHGEDGDGGDDDREDHDGGDGSSVTGGAPPGRDRTGNKVFDKRVGALATGTDELSWIMREVI